MLGKYFDPKTFEYEDEDGELRDGSPEEPKRWFVINNVFKDFNNNTINKDFDDNPMSTLGNLNDLVVGFMSKYGSDAVIDFKVNNYSIDMRVAHFAGSQNAESIAGQVQGQPRLSQMESVKIMDPFGKDGSDAELAQLKSRTNRLTNR